MLGGTESQSKAEEAPRKPSGWYRVAVYGRDTACAVLIKTHDLGRTNHKAQAEAKEATVRAFK